jgi:hypothetical protein
MDNAMLSGKPLLGFKCMSCDHNLDKLNPIRANHIPTGVMPRSFLSMLSAERIFSQVCSFFCPQQIEAFLNFLVC